MLKINIICLSLLALVFAMVSYPISSANALEIGESEINEKQLDLALEISESDLTETTVVKNGKLVLKYDSYKKANVSKETFKRFNKLVGVVNGYIKDGIVVPKGNINDVLNTHPDMKAVDNSTEVKNGDISTKITVKKDFVRMNNSETNKAIKIISAAGAVAAFAAAFLLTIPIAGIVAAAVGFIGAGLNLCNWNDRGVDIRKVVNWWVCVPR